MRNADAIVFMLIIGYIVFTTMNGNLRKWLDVFGIRTNITPDFISSGRELLKGQR